MVIRDFIYSARQLGLLWRRAMRYYLQFNYDMTEKFCFMSSSIYDIRNEFIIAAWGISILLI